MRSFRRNSPAVNANTRPTQSARGNTSNSNNARVDNSSSSSQPTETSNSGSASSSRCPNPQSSQMSTKHLCITFPPADHKLLHETVFLLFSVCAFFLQLLHLYRTVWWLPQSYTHHAVVNIKSEAICPFSIKLLNSTFSLFFRNFIS